MAEKGRRSREKQKVDLPKIKGAQHYDSSCEREKDQLTDPPQLRKTNQKTITQNTMYKNAEVTTQKLT